MHKIHFGKKKKKTWVPGAGTLALIQGKTSLQELCKKAAALIQNKLMAKIRDDPWERRKVT